MPSREFFFQILRKRFQHFWQLGLDVLHHGQQLRGVMWGMHFVTFCVCPGDRPSDMIVINPKSAIFSMNEGTLVRSASLSSARSRVVFNSASNCNSQSQKIQRLGSHVGQARPLSQSCALHTSHVFMHEMGAGILGCA